MVSVELSKTSSSAVVRSISAAIDSYTHAVDLSCKARSLEGSQPAL
jgi:hypothetical protein